MQFSNIPDLTAAITVTNVGATITYTEGTDYVINTAGVYITTGSTIVEASTILIDYTKKAANVMQALVNSAQEYKMVFAGLNEAQSGKAVVLTVHRFKPGAAQNISMIGDDYASLDLPGEALSDSAITGAGLSKFYTVQVRLINDPP